MRILFVTNYYPPSDRGWGYMQLCEEVASGLATRGHEITVLTSTQRDGAEISRPYPVHRLLIIDPDWHSGSPAAWQFFVGRRQREKQAVTHLMRLVEQRKPQVILIWHPIGLPRVLLQVAERQKEWATAYYMADYAPELLDEYVAYWKAQPVHPLAKIYKSPLARIALHQLQREGKPIHLGYPHVICVSEYVRQRLVSQGLIPPDAVVIHNGIDLSVFSSKEHAQYDTHRSDFRCLVAGRVTKEKGVHTVIEAFAEVNHNRVSNSHRISLTILGDGPAEYMAFLKDRVERYHLHDRVTFEPPISRYKMPEKLSGYDALILSSEYAEPLARSMQEAMAVGLVVIGTRTGGSGELLKPEQTGLAFKAGNAHSLAQQLVRALSDPELVTRLAKAGQERVRTEFRIDQTVSNIEAYLQRLMEEQYR